MLFTSTVLAAALSCTAPSSADLVGLWESTTTSQGGIGHVFEFRKDGSFVEATSVLVNAPVAPDAIDQAIQQARMQGATGDIRQGVKYRHHTGAMAYQRLTEQGEMLFRLPLRTASGCYTAARTSLTLDPFRGKRTRMAMALKGSTLDLRADGSASLSQYRRSPLGPWYDIDRIDYERPARPPGN